MSFRDGTSDARAPLETGAAVPAAPEPGALRPLVSVVIPCYNQAHFLTQSVESVASQTLREWEIIVVNDGSPDDTSAVAEKLIRKHPGRLRLIEQPNGGLAAARNAGIRAAQADYVFLLDADDCIEPTMLEKTRAMLQAHPEAGFAYTDIQHFGDQKDVYRYSGFDPETLIHTENIVCGNCLVRKSMWEQAGGYDESMREGYEDWDFWIRCVEKGWKGHHLPEPLFLYRKKASSMLGAANEKRQRLIARIVLNHPALYHPSRVQEAQRVLAGQPAGDRRILLACSHFYPSVGGLETIAENLGAHLVRLGYRVEVATLPHPQRRLPLHRGVTIRPLDPKIASGDTPRASAQLRALVASGDYDACILLADPLNWILWSIEGLEIPARTKVLAQPIINAEGFERWRENKDFRRRLTALLQRAHSVVTLSTNGPEVKFLREEAITHFCIPNAVSAGEPSTGFRDRHGLPASVPMLLHVANLWPVKNHPGLMRTLRVMPGDWRLVMVGYPSADADYVAQVRQLAASDPRFLLLPGLPPAEVAAAREAADVVLLASLGEVSPVTILEAMSCGKPWVATPDCGAVHDNAGGIIAPLRSFPDLLQKLLENAELRRELGRLGREHWQASFRWEQVIRAWVGAIEGRPAENSLAQPPSVARGIEQLRAELGCEAILAAAARAPKVSVIVPTFNRPERLEIALKSILGQTLQDFEVVVVNDGGEDVQEILKRLGAPQQLLYKRHPANRGMAAARNTGLQFANGKYVAYLDDDDIFLPEHLQTLVALLESTGSKAAYTDAYRAREEKVDGHYQVTERDVPFSCDWDKERILVKNFVPMLCFMHERAMGISAGGFDESFTTHEDWDFWIRLGRLCTPVHIPRVTCEFRVRDGGGSVTQSRQADFLRTLRAIYQKHRALAARNRQVRRRQRRFLSQNEELFARSQGLPTRRWFHRLWPFRA